MMFYEKQTNSATICTSLVVLVSIGLFINSCTKPNPKYKPDAGKDTSLPDPGDSDVDSDADSDTDTDSDGDSDTLTDPPTPVAPIIARFQTEPVSVVKNQASDVNWTWQYSNSPVPTPTCSIDNSVGDINSGDTKKVTLESTTTFTLTCTNEAGLNTAETTINVVEEAVAPIIASFTAEPASVVENQTTNITWTWTYSNSPTPMPTCNINNGVGKVNNGDVTSIALGEDTTFTLVCSNQAGNNIAQTTISVVDNAVAPIIASFSAEPSLVTKGESSNVKWTWTYANSPTPTPSCSIDNGVGTIVSGDEKSITLTYETTFTLHCTNDAGSNTAETTISVVDASIKPIIATFTASPSSVTEGETTLVRWAWTYENSPTPTPSCSINNGVGAVISGDEKSVNLDADTNFTLICTNDAGSDTTETTITVVDKSVAPIISDLTASPSSVTEGETTRIKWTWKYTNNPTPTPSCMIDNGVGAIVSGGTKNITLTTETNFTLTCVNDGGSHTAQTTIEVVEASVEPEISSFEASPSTVTEDVTTSIKWTWNYSNSPTPTPTCSIDHGIGAVESGDAKNITLTSTTTFTLTCENEAGSNTAQKRIDVEEAPDCTSGICCNTATKKFRPEGTECDKWYDYECTSIDCGGDALEITFTQVCSGRSADCEGAIDESPPETTLCAASELCVTDNANYARCEENLECACSVTGTWYDPISELCWQNPTGGMFGTWDSAKNYCNNLSHAGYNDWRLPNIQELISLLRGCVNGDVTPGLSLSACTGLTDPTCLGLECIETGCGSCWDLGPDDDPNGCFWHPELSSPQCYYTWSSSTYADDTTQAWAVIFWNGAPTAADKNRDHDPYSVRCMRDGK